MHRATDIKSNLRNCFRKGSVIILGNPLDNKGYLRFLTLFLDRSWLKRCWKQLQELIGCIFSKSFGKVVENYKTIWLKLTKYLVNSSKLSFFSDDFLSKLCALNYLNSYDLRKKELKVISLLSFKAANNIKIT